MTIARLHLHAHPWTERPLRLCLEQVIAPTRLQPGCIDVQLIASQGDPRGFVLLSAWVDESAFCAHAAESHTEGFLTRVRPLLDRDLQFDLA